jgi:dienelactone hydrolase
MKRITAKVSILTSMMCILMICAQAQIGEPGKASIASMKTEEFSYKTNGVTQKGYIAFVPNAKNKLPIVLVVPDWWGYGSYAKSRARQLAELGYFAMVVDMYGDGKVAATPTEAQKYSGEFYKDPALGKARIEAAETKVKSFVHVDPRRISAIGYCFGGTMVLNAANMGMDFRGVVSFHGGLKTIPAVRGMVKSKMLICHGGSDKFVTAEDVSNFRSNLDSAGVRYLFKVYPNATHAFTNPESTAIGKKFDMPIAYNKEADETSWQDMRVFLREVFYSK